MGDLVDCGIKSAIGGSAYEQALTPNEQLNTICKIFERFKDQIDGCVIGNHEYRIYKESGIDVLEQFCHRLDIPYMLYSGVTTYSINNDRAYNFNYFHGKSGGGIESALRACKKMSNQVTSDVYLMGHCHHSAYTKRAMKYIDSRNKKITEGIQYFVLTGHSLTYDDSYADQAGLEISVKGFPIIELTATGNKSIKIIT